MTYINLNYKYRIYPNKSQKNFIARQAGCCRFVWNKFVALIKNHGYMTYNEMAHYLAHVLKHEFPFLNEVKGQPLQQTLMDLSKAYKAARRYSYLPNFKKKSGRQSCRFPQRIKVCQDISKLTVSKVLKNIPIVLDRALPDFTMCTIIKESDDRYYACFIVEQECKEHIPNLEIKHTGLDLGLKDLITTSAGEVIKPPKFFRKSEENLARKNRSLSKKEKGSRRWLRARKRLSRTHARVRRQRTDFLHKLTTKLVNDNEAIAVESLNIKNMVKNHNLAKSIMDASWTKLCSMLMYKMLMRGKSFISCGGIFPSTQLCSSCNNQTGPKGINNLKIRLWACSVCGAIHNRDINAAKNIGLEGDRLSGFIV